MSYQVLIKRSAEKELEALPAELQDRIVRKLLVLEGNPRPQGVKKLQGGNTYRLRVGDYRVLYVGSMIKLN
jgi:mRNA interferase RelE/StbE